MIYLDTGCLLKLYYPEPESRRVAKLASGEAIAFIALHELEITNALELKLFRKEATPAQIRATTTLVEGTCARECFTVPPSLGRISCGKRAASPERRRTRSAVGRSTSCIARQHAASQ